MGRTRMFHEYDNDLISNFINIDTLADVLTVAQEMEGIEPTFKVAKVDDNGNKTRKAVECKETKHDKCKACHASKPKDKTGDIDSIDWDLVASPFDYTSDDEDDDTDYICEYCDSLGYTQKYIPDVCDRCSVCESCTEYQTDCDGCSFSVFRDGHYYRDKLSESDLVDVDDLDKFNEIEECNKERLERKSFSVSRRI